MRGRFAIAAVAISLLFENVSFAGRAQFYTFAEWERLSPSSQSAYVAGVLDGVTSFSIEPLDRGMADQYSACVERPRITNGQLRDALLQKVLKRPAIRSGTVLSATLGYLHEMCPDLLGLPAFNRLLDSLQDQK